jgi:dihydrofolate synthase/folylpolyglutamate synthase
MVSESAAIRVPDLLLSGDALPLRGMVELMQLLGDPQNELCYVHVAGSNGKGSTCAMLAAILTASGYRTGLFTSPHLSRLNERFVIDGQEATDADLAMLSAKVLSAAEFLAEEPTEFEILTAMALLYCREKRCDIVVLEAGLGGRLDATNVIACPEVAVITNIALEHTDRLGDTLTAIALEKAGIIKQGGTVVVGSVAKPVRAVLERACEERRANLYWADQDEAVVHQQGIDGQCFDWRGHADLSIGLLGRHQVENATVALSVVDCLSRRGWTIDDTALRQGFATVRWPARLEILSHQPLFILDGAHNPSGLELLLQSLEPLLARGKVVFLAGVMGNKDYRRMLRQIAPYAQELLCLAPDCDKALPSVRLKECADARGIPATAFDDVAEGVMTALRVACGQPIVVFGSLYLAGAVRELYPSIHQRWQQLVCGQ